MDGCQIVATVDPDAGWSRLRPIDWYKQPPEHYQDIREMLEIEKPEACVVAVPDDQHRQVAQQVMDAGCDLLLEKPIATNVEDCDAIIDYARTRKRVLQIGLVYRYSNLYRKMAEIARQPDWDVKLMWCKEMRQCFPQRPWFYSQEKTGGTIVEKDCHHFDIFNWVIGSSPVRVFATGGQHVWKSGAQVKCTYCPEPARTIKEIDTVDHALVCIDYANGARANLILCMYLRPENVMPEGLEIGAISTNGMQMAAYRDERLCVGGLDQPWHQVRVDMYSDSQNIGHIGSQAQRREFLQCIRTRQTPFADARVGRESLLIALAAERSIREGRPIEIDELQPVAMEKIG